MWFGTYEGLNKFDGYTFTVYKYNRSNLKSIGNDIILDILEDKKGNLWIATSLGLELFDRNTETFIHYKRNGANFWAESLFQDSKGQLWVGTDQGLWLLDLTTRTFTEYQHQPNNATSLSNNFVDQITEDLEGNLWLATNDGLNRFDPQRKTFTSYKHDPGNVHSIGSDLVVTVFIDSKGKLWVGTQGSGIARYNKTTNAFTNFRYDPENKNGISHNDILSFMEDKNGKLWVGTENGGISILNTHNNTFATYTHDDNDPTTVSSNSIHSLYKDNIGNVWIGTYSAGINLLTRFGKKFALYTHLPNRLNHNNVLCIKGDSEENIWIGTDGGGLDRFDRKAKTFEHYSTEKTGSKQIKGNYIHYVLEVGKGVLAIGYHRRGFELFSTRTGSIAYYMPQKGNPRSLSNANVMMMIQARDGTLWLGTYGGGLNSYDLKTRQFTQYLPNSKDPNSLAGTIVYCLLEDKEGNIWAGTNNGLDLLDRKTNRFIHHQYDPNNPHSLTHNLVQTLLEDSKSNIWVGTAGGGLNLYHKKTNTFTLYTEAEGLANNTIWGILEDKKGVLWISSNKGLTKFIPAKTTCQNYGISDGIQANEFKANACYQTADGEMYFGGVKGFNAFYPDSIQRNPVIPSVFITNFQVFNRVLAIQGADSLLKKSILETNELTLSYQQDVFSLEFTALNYTSTEKNQYSYRMEGFDKDWAYVGAQRKATYTNLNPGTYVFKVKAANNDCIWNEQGDSLIIHILPPWWKTPWFRILSGLLIIGLVVSIYNIRLKTIKQQNKRLEKLVDDRTRNLQFANEEINEINQELVVREEEIKSQNEDLFQQREELISQNEELVRSQTEIDEQRRLLSQQNQELSEARQIIECQNEEILLQNQGLDLEVKERTKELVEYTQQLEQFAFIVAHNLRSPVARILGLGHVLELSKNSPEDERMIISKMILTTEELDRVVRDINMILEVRKNNTLPISEINLSEEVAMIKSNLETEIQDTQAEIIEDFSDISTLQTVKPYIDSILINLISNAIKYRDTKRNPCIKIKTEIQAEYVCLSVSDNGLGIDMEANKKNIFNLYKRFHTHVEGKGMGLYLVKTQVIALGGKIEVESEVNKGSTFKVFLKNNGSQQKNGNSTA